MAASTGEAGICNLALLKVGVTKELIDDLETDTSVNAEVCRMLYPQSRDDLLRGFKWPFATRRARLPQLGGSEWSALTTYGLGAYANQAPSATVTVNMPENATEFVYISLQAGNVGHSPQSSPTWWRQISRAAWAFAFALPSDYLQMQSIYRLTRNPREDEQVPYVIEAETAPAPGKVLLSDAGVSWEVFWSSPDQQNILTPLEIVYTARIEDTAQFPSDFSSALAWDIAEDLALALLKDPQKAKWAHDAARESLAVATAAARRETRPDLPPLPSHIRARR